MAQYSSGHYYDFVNPQDRTKYWVSSHTSRASGFYSPSAPAPNIEGIPAAPPSDAGSTDSTPPKMVLRYNDGRPDMPIPPSHRHRTMSHGQHLRQPHHSIPHSRPAPENLQSSGPEDIKVLPSAAAPATASSSRPSHGRSKSLGRGSDRDRPSRHREYEEHHHHHHHQPSQPIYYNGYGPEYAQPAHHSRHHKQPSASGYGSSSSHRHHHQQPHYASNVYHPHQIGPNGVMYSHSAPVPYPPNYPATAYPPSKSVHDSRAGHGRSSRSRSRKRHHHNGSTASLDSQDDEGAFYGHPAHGQGIHVITPSPAPSIGGGGSSTKLSSSAYAHGSGKKHFFHRFFSRFSSTSSSEGERRHSMGGRPGH